MTEALAVDAARLREEVQNKYRGVATAPGATYHFHTGRAAARPQRSFAFLADRLLTRRAPAGTGYSPEPADRRVTGAAAPPSA